MAPRILVKENAQSIYLEKIKEENKKVDEDFSKKLLAVQWTELKVVYYLMCWVNAKYKREIITIGDDYIEKYIYD